MKVTGFVKTTMLFSALAFVVSASPAEAQDKTQGKCRKTIAKTLGKYNATAAKAVAKCHKDTNKGKRSGADCNDADIADDKGKIAKAEDKMLFLIEKSCNDKDSGVPNAGVLAEYVACPSPNQAADGGDGFQTFEEVSDCLIATSKTWNLKLYKDIFGTPAAALAPAEKLGKVQDKCHGAIVKDSIKLLATVAKERAKCQDTTDKALAVTIPNHAACAENDTKGKIAQARAKLLADITKQCGTMTTEDWTSFGVCSVSEAGYQTCAIDRALLSVGGGLSAIAYELPAGCPVEGVRVFINPGAGGANGATKTSLNTGWTGLAHNADVIDGYEGAVTVDCSASDDCSACTVTLDPVKTAGNSYCRCDADVTVSCDTIDGADADDCGGGDCSCFFGPPLPLAAGGISTCVTNEIVAELDGLADVGAGTSTTTVSTAAKVHTGGSGTLQIPCPICAGDTTPNDGSRDGLCEGGPRDTLACDENGRNDGFGGGLSYDCQPDPGTNATGTGIKLALELTTGTTSLPQTITCGGALPAENCWCRTCGNDLTVGCGSDQDCVDAGVGGTCGDVTEPQTQPNNCVDTICDTAGFANGFGFCAANSPNQFCDGQVQNSGKGIVPCSSNGDCTALDASCIGGDCGDCTLSETVGCFDGTIDATGTPGSLGAELVSTFCTAHTSNGGVNAAGGLPGPARLVLDFDFEARCSDGDLAQAPGFVNCQIPD